MWKLRLWKRTTETEFEDLALRIPYIRGNRVYIPEYRELLGMIRGKSETKGKVAFKKEILDNNRFPEGLVRTGCKWCASKAVFLYVVGGEHHGGCARILQGRMIEGAGGGRERDRHREKFRDSWEESA